MPNQKKPTRPDAEAAPSDYRAATTDEHVDHESGERVPTPDPKDQTGDPDEMNPAMRELRDRQNRRPTEG
jgi:hypothetical protein